MLGFSKLARKSAITPAPFLVTSRVEMSSPHNKAARAKTRLIVKLFDSMSNQNEDNRGIVSYQIPKE
uniref:Uncharacterized protein n=1 Tax=Romanomermis culicivorax TaxID=13658 RepID=A0A915J160_ROMCU